MFNQALLAPRDPGLIFEFPFVGNRSNRGRSDYNLDINNTIPFNTIPNMPYGNRAAGQFASANYFVFPALARTVLTNMTDFTVEFFYYQLTAPLFDVLFRWQGAVQAWEISMGTNASDPATIQLRRFEGGWGGVATPAEIRTGRWYHIACTFTGSTGKIYIDGVQRVTGNIDTYTPGAITLAIIGSDTNAFVHGYINDFKIFNYVKTKFPSAA